VDNVRVGTLENRVTISLTIPSVAVPVPVLPIFSEDGAGFLTLEVSNVNSVKLKAGVMSSVPLSFFSSGVEGMVSIGFLSLPSVGVGVEAVRLVEPIVEEVKYKVNKQLLADANKLMTDARIKGMKAVASLAGHTSVVLSVAFSPDGQHIVSGSSDNLVKVWSVCEEGGCVAGWAHG